MKIFFFLEPSNSKEVSIKYRFENDCLIHNIDKTVHFAKMEVKNILLNVFLLKFKHTINIKAMDRKIPG